MKILKLNHLDTENQIDSLVSELRNNKVIALPTDTCYGLSAIISPETIEKIYQIKKRPKNKPLSIFIRKNWANRYMDLSESGQKIIDYFWPGALTLISAIKTDKADFLNPVTNHQGRVAFREPNFNLLIRILNKLEVPITATSANLTEQPESFSPEEVKKQFINQKYQPDYLIDGGDLPKRLTSTIIEQDPLKILRAGEIKKDVVIRFLNSQS